MGETVGSTRRMAIDTALPFDANSVWIEFDTEDLRVEEEILRSDGIRGTRTAESQLGCVAGRKVTGSITFTLTRQAADAWLPAILGAAEATDVFLPAEAIPDLYIMIDKGSDVVVISEAKVSTAEIKGDQQQLIKVTVSLEAEDLLDGQTWPGTLVQPDLTTPYCFSELSSVTLLSTARTVFGFNVKVDNVLSSNEFGNNVTRDELIVATDRIVTATLRVGGGTENVDLTDHVGSTGVEGEAVSLVLTSTNESGSSFTIALGRVAFPKQQPRIAGKGATRIELTGQARGKLQPGQTGHVPDIKCTNVAG